MQYLDATGAKNVYTVCRSQFGTLLKEMERTGRYPDGAVIRQSGKNIVLATAFHDYMRNRFALRAGLEVPEYSAEEVRKEMRKLEI